MTPLSHESFRMVFFVRLRSFGHVAVHAGAARLSAETAAHAAEILTGLLSAHLSRLLTAEILTGLLSVHLSGLLTAEILSGLLTAHLSGHTVGAGCTALVIEREILGNIDLSVIVYLICYSSLN